MKDEAIETIAQFIRNSPDREKAELFKKRLALVIKIVEDEINRPHQAYWKREELHEMFKKIETASKTDFQEDVKMTCSGCGKYHSIFINCPASVVSSI